MSDQHGQLPQWSSQQHYPLPSFYTQPTQASPGPFQQPPYAHIPPSRKRPRWWGWYHTRTRKMNVGLGCATLIAVLLFFCANLAATPTTSSDREARIISPVATLRPTPPPSPTSTLKQTIAPTSPPSPPCPGVNCNPWGYNFRLGNLIYSPPAAFCHYFPCISSFPYRPGHVVECQDGEYSKSGGVLEGCFTHGGVLRPLYAH